MNFNKWNGLKLQQLQRNKKQPKGFFWESLVKSHTTLWERLIRTGALEAIYDNNGECLRQTVAITLISSHCHLSLIPREHKKW